MALRKGKTAALTTAPGLAGSGAVFRCVRRSGSFGRRGPLHGAHPFALKARHWQACVVVPWARATGAPRGPGSIPGENAGTHAVLVGGGHHKFNPSCEDPTLSLQHRSSRGQKGRCNLMKNHGIPRCSKDQPCKTPPKRGAFCSFFPSELRNASRNLAQKTVFSVHTLNAAVRRLGQ